MRVTPARGVLSIAPIIIKDLGLRRTCEPVHSIPGSMETITDLAIWRAAAVLANSKIGSRKDVMSNIENVEKRFICQLTIFRMNFIILLTFDASN